MERVDDLDDHGSFEPAPYLGGVSTWVVKRGGQWQLDNGLCRGSRLLVYMSGEGPKKTADCKANEVSVPRVIGMTEAVAVALLATAPLDAAVAYVRRNPDACPGSVNQDPRRGGARRTIRFSSSSRSATVSFRTSWGRACKPQATRCVGFVSIPARSRDRAEGIVIRQSLEAGVAAAPGLKIRLVVGDGSQRESS